MFNHTRAIDVYLWGKKAGSLVPAFGKRGVYAFAYDKAFIAGGIEIAPLEMPLSGRVYEFAGFPRQAFLGLPPAIADSLPDSFGNMLIDRYLAERGVDKAEITALDRLAYTGSRAPGALTFRPARGAGFSDDSPVQIGKLVEQAQRVLNGDISGKTASEQLNEIIRLGSSLGGAQAKAVVGWNRIDGSFRYGTADLPLEYEHWIIKFSPSDRPNRGQIEYRMYELARACGIEMMESLLYEHEGIGHFMTRRFDRQRGERQHVLTFAAMCHIFPGTAHGETNASYEQLFMAIRRLGMEYDSLEQMFRRMVFNVVMEEFDDHVKNFAFLLPRGGSWRLAPAYDLTGTPASSEDDMWGNFAKCHAMSINGKQSGITDADLLKVADRFGIGDAKRIITSIRDICS